MVPQRGLSQGSLSMVHRLLRLIGALSLVAFAGSTTASAAVFRWANDGDVSSMDPYTRNETVQLSFLANIYEPLIRRNRELGLEPSLAVKWEQTSPTV
jgi:peptide/nickel transport system substrate-binding protein